MASSDIQTRLYSLPLALPTHCKPPKSVSPSCLSLSLPTAAETQIWRCTRSFSMEEVSYRLRDCTGWGLSDVFLVCLHTSYS